MPDKNGCSHPRMCPPEDSFSAKIKQEKLSLDPPPPAVATGKENRR